MGFKQHIETAKREDSKALIREGALVFGSIRKLVPHVRFSATHVYRLSNAESSMSLADYEEIKSIIALEKRKKEKNS